MVRGPIATTGIEPGADYRKIAALINAEPADEKPL